MRRMDERLAAVESTQQQMSALLKQVVARLGALEERQDQHEARLAAIEATQKQMATLLEQIRARQDQHETRLAEVEATQRRMADLLEQVVAKQNQADERLDRTEAWQKRADERFDNIDAWQKRAEEWQERTDERLDRTEAWQDKTDARLDRMDTRMDNIETSLRDVKRHSDSMWGEWVERKAADKLVPYIGHIYRANRVYPFWGEHGAAKDYRRDAFEDAISDAEDDGSIHHEEAFRLRETDLVIRARRKSDGATLWFVVEASGTLDDDDIERVERSAAALRKVYPHEEVAPMLFGYRISSRYKQAADDGNIQVVLTDG